MSAVISQAKHDYRRALGLEGLILVGLSLIAGVAGDVHSLASFASGAVASFVPHCLFVYWIFFRRNAKNANKMTAFYRGEGLKWLATIGLVVLSFKALPELRYLAFFAGYFLGLVGNIALPMWCKRSAK